MGKNKFQDFDYDDYLEDEDEYEDLDFEVERALKQFRKEKKNKMKKKDFEE